MEGSTRTKTKAGGFLSKTGGASVSTCTLGWSFIQHRRQDQVVPQAKAIENL
jgi:hypothetical protein